MGSPVETAQAEMSWTNKWVLLEREGQTGKALVVVKAAAAFHRTLLCLLHIFAHKARVFAWSEERWGLSHRSSNG